MRLDFFEVGLQVGHLILNLALVPIENHQELAQLRHGVARALVGVDDFLGLGQTQSQALGPQGELEAGAMTGAVDGVAPARTFALGLQQAHVFIKAHGPGGQVKFLGEVADGVSDGHAQ